MPQTEARGSSLPAQDGLRLHQVLVSHLVGGAAMVALRLAQAASRRAISCVAWVPGDGPAAEALDRQQTRRHVYDLNAMKGGVVGHVGACAQMVPALIGLTRPVVHIHDPTVFRLLRPALLAAGARTVVHLHLEHNPEELRWAFRSPPAHIIACAKYIAMRVDSILETRARTVPVSAIPNGIDLERFTPGDPAAARARLGLSTDRFVVLMLANLSPHKGQATTLRALGVLTRRGMPVECWLVGEDRSPGREYERELRVLCQHLDLGDRVRFLGFRTDAPDLLRAADVFVLPSTLEGLPLSVLEAHAAHVPVIGSTIPGIREVVEDGTTGFTVPAEDFDTYADRLQALFDNPRLRAQLTAAAAAQVARQYGWPHVEQRVFEIYRSFH
jgi:glycosyltransferase involved in cell wall biosynthesis